MTWFKHLTARWLTHPRVQLIFGTMGALGALYVLARLAHPQVKHLTKVKGRKL